jgi:glycosyltransferase involved in cell wall biosynthesis
MRTAPDTAPAAAPMPAPLSIGVVTSSISRNAGGLFESVRAGAIGIGRMGLDVAVYGLADAHSEEDAAAWRPVPVRAFAHVGPAAFGFSPPLARALDAGGHDLLHLHGIWMFPSVAVSGWRKRRRRPVVISPRGMLDPWALRNSGLRKRVARLLYEGRNLDGAACLHALAQAEADAFRAAGVRRPVAVIPNGVHIPQLDGRGPRPAWLGEDGRRVLLFLGRIHPKKGLGETLRAWARLKVRAPGVAAEWRLAVAGWDDGGYLAGLCRLRDDLGLARDVVFPGPLFGDAKAQALRHADAFLLASHSEGLPMAVLEAWAHRLPVFMSDACNLPEGFAAGAAVRVVPEPEALAETLATHLPDSALASLGHAGRALAARRFSWEAIARRHVALYGWLTRGGAQPDFVRCD